MEFFLTLAAANGWTLTNNAFNARRTIEFSRGAATVVVNVARNGAVMTAQRSERSCNRGYRVSRLREVLSRGDSDKRAKVVAWLTASYRDTAPDLTPVSRYSVPTLRSGDVLIWPGTAGLPGDPVTLAAQRVVTAVNGEHVQTLSVYGDTGELTRTGLAADGVLLLGRDLLSTLRAYSMVSGIAVARYRELFSDRLTVLAEERLQASFAEWELELIAGAARAAAPIDDDGDEDSDGEIRHHADRIERGSLSALSAGDHIAYEGSSSVGRISDVADDHAHVVWQHLGGSAGTWVRRDSLIGALHASAAYPVMPYVRERVALRLFNKGDVIAGPVIDITRGHNPIVSVQRDDTGEVITVRADRFALWRVTPVPAAPAGTAQTTLTRIRVSSFELRVGDEFTFDTELDTAPMYLYRDEDRHGTVVEINQRSGERWILHYRARNGESESRYIRRTDYVFVMRAVDIVDADLITQRDRFECLTDRANWAARTTLEHRGRTTVRYVGPRGNAAVVTWNAYGRAVDSSLSISQMFGDYASADLAEIAERVRANPRAAAPAVSPSFQPIF